MLIGMAKLGGLFLRTCEKVMKLLRYGDWNMAEGGGQYQLFLRGGGGLVTVQTSDLAQEHVRHCCNSCRKVAAGFWLY
jgi:hypothetical protein